MLCKRYGGGIDYVLSLDFAEGLALILQAYRGDTEDRLFELWNIERFHLEQISKLSFSEYLEKAFKPRTIAPKQTKEAIISKAEEIKRMDQRRG